MRTLENYGTRRCKLFSRKEDYPKDDQITPPKKTKFFVWVISKFKFEVSLIINLKFCLCFVNNELQAFENIKGQPFVSS